MIRNRCSIAIMFLVCLCFTNCNFNKKGSGSTHFDELSRTVEVGNWQFVLNVENQNKKKGTVNADSKNQYLKVTLYLSNIKTQKSLLYSLSDDIEDYEGKYKYLSFNSKDDLYIKSGDEYIHPIGYVFEPSNGLSNSERLVYKFQISEDMYKKLIKNNEAVEYWYIDRLIGLGKICFKQQ